MRGIYYHEAEVMCVEVYDARVSESVIARAALSVLSERALKCF